VKLTLLVVSALAIVAVTLAVLPSRPSTTTTTTAADADAPFSSGRVLGPSDEPPSGEAPPGMVWIPGGEFLMGSDEPMFADARPVHRVAVDGFWMDATEVTNAAFARFVDATGYVTAAERAPRPE
jgi:formylglycine-generating enzyme required for sulfatase activity